MNLHTIEVVEFLIPLHGVLSVAVRKQSQGAEYEQWLRIGELVRKKKKK